MKKRIYALLFLGLFAFLLCGCSQGKSSAMYIKPSEFSKETMEVLDLFDEEVQFFDLSLDQTAKSYVVTVWVYDDGEWVEKGDISGNVEELTERIAVRLTKTSFELYTIDKSGHTKSSYPTLDISFEKSTGIGNRKIEDLTPIELNREIPIWVKIGTNGNSIETGAITDDFRAAKCDEGIAITLTVSDEIKE